MERLANHIVLLRNVERICNDNRKLDTVCDGQLCRPDNADDVTTNDWKCERHAKEYMNRMANTIHGAVKNYVVSKKKYKEVVTMVAVCDVENCDEFAVLNSPCHVLCYTHSNQMQQGCPACKQQTS